MGFAFPAPRLIALPVRPEGLSFQTRGMDTVSGDSRLTPASGRPGKPALPSAARPPLRPPRRPVRLPLPCPCAAPPVGHPPACADLRPVNLPGPGCPVLVATSASRRDPCGGPRCRGCLSRYLPTAAAGVTVDSGWLPSGTDPCGPDALPAVGLSASRPLTTSGFSAFDLPGHPEG